MPHPRAALAALLLAALGCTGNPCPVPLELCGDVCYDLRYDVQHCGACNAVCDAGLACISGVCVVDPTSGSCADRAGGAFVTLEACGSIVKFWAIAPAFISRAEALLADPSSPGPAIPRFDLRDGTDCDPQWTWHVDPATATFLASPDGICSGCPAYVEEAKPYWLVDVGTWCPDLAVQHVRVVAVDRR
ncbi:BP74-related protein [Anaeromyxobacter oryzae]|uniref:BP74 N-terminal domain-containing protein n=1 Tax=Anaeromyxobacter oryzae TaxID=2918170 RepID=A0ABM7WYF6_9BACT|nr:hypothetical protein [Anaeromyxobacter oryzae]BDG04551.1 hypothetical protein AMOR_35470 [Anaeromyxobacter oryzae]